MEVSPPTVEEIKGVLKNHPKESLAKQQIALEIAQQRFHCASGPEIDEAATVLQSYLEAMRLRDISRVRRSKLN